MSRFLSGAPLAICDRCRVKMLHKELSPDRDKPGLLVCRACNDVKDPWRLPFTPRDANIAVPKARPEEALAQPTTAVTGVNAEGHLVEGAIPSNLNVTPSST